MNAYKAYFVFRTDLDLTTAKLAVQVGHGVDLIWGNSSNNLSAFNAWLAKESGDRRKIVLKLKTLEQLNNLKKTLVSDGIQCELINSCSFFASIQLENRLFNWLLHAVLPNFDTFSHQLQFC